MKNKTYRFAAALAVLLTFCLVFMAPVGAVNSDLFASGLGTSENPYQIANAEQFANISKLTGERGTTVHLQLTQSFAINEFTGDYVHIGTEDGTAISLPDIIFDLNGCTISAKEITVGNSALIKIEDTNFTIKDSSNSNGMLELSSSTDRNWDSSSAVISVEGYGHVIVNGGIIRHNGGTDMAMAIDVTAQNWDGPCQLTVNGGILESTYVAIRGCSNGGNGNIDGDSKATIYVNGGILKGERRGIYIQPILGSEPISLTISGGEISAIESNIVEPHSAVHICFEKGTNVQFSMTGGTLQTVADDAPALSITTDNSEYNVGQSSFTISGGYLIGESVEDKLLISKFNTPPVVTVSNTLLGIEIDNADTAKQYESVEFTAELTAVEGITYTAPTSGVTYEWKIDGDVISGETGNTLTYTFTDIEEHEVTVTAKMGESTAVAVKTIAVTEGDAPSFDDKVDTEESGDGDVIATITTQTEPSITDGKTEVTLFVEGAQMTVTLTEASINTGSVSGVVSSVKVTFDEGSTLESDDENGATESGKFNLELALTTPDVDLPTFDPVFKEDVEEKIVEILGDEHKPLTMITAEHDDKTALNSNITENGITIIFKIPVSALGGVSEKRLVGYHVDGDSVEEITPLSIKVEGDFVVVVINGSSFSTYGVGIGPEEISENDEVISSGTSGKDTGSGNYQYYPRSVTSDCIVDFGSSKVVKGMELPAGSSGTVTLNTKPTFAMPENGFYAFEIDAPGYNLDAKINGGLSFQIPVADLEAAGFTAKDIVLFHGTVAEDGKIVWEALPTNLVKNENGVAYYKAAINGCSPFYIGFVKDGSVVNTEVVDPVTPETPETPVTPDEPEVLPPVDEPETPEQPTESPAPILAVLAGLGAAAVLRRK